VHKRLFFHLQSPTSLGRQRSQNPLHSFSYSCTFFLLHALPLLDASLDTAKQNNARSFNAQRSHVLVRNESCKRPLSHSHIIQCCVCIHMHWHKLRSRICVRAITRPMSPNSREYSLSRAVVHTCSWTSVPEHKSHSMVGKHFAAHCLYSLLYLPLSLPLSVGMFSQSRVRP